MKQTYYKLRRVAKWLPVIWRTREYDYRYLIDINLFQLEQMAKFFESSDTVSMESKDIARRIRTVHNLMKKVYDEDYALECFSKMEQLYGECNMEFRKIGTSNLYEIVDVYDREYTEEELEKIKIHRSQLIKESERKQERAHDLLWRLISHNIRRWWD